MDNNSGNIEANNSVIINAQYIKDLSFENPKAPNSLMLESQPEIDVALDIAANPLGDKVFEVILDIQVHSAHNEQTLFVIDLQYAGVFTIDVNDEAKKELTLLVYCPSMLFPYARRVISDISRDGGFPPLMLSPVDFMGLYLQKKEAKMDKGKEETKTIN